MLILVAGPSGRFAELCVAVTVRLMSKALGSAELVRANAAKEITRNLMLGKAAHNVVAASSPGGRIGRALAEARRPFVVAGDAPRTVLYELVTTSGMELAAATQIVASSCASLPFFRSIPGALVLDPGGKIVDAASLAAAIARHLNFDLAPDDIVEAVHGLSAADPIATAEQALAWWDGLDPAERTTASGALDAYDDAAEEAGVEPPIVWKSGLFFAGDQPSARAAQGVDITGRPRCLLHGPHIVLPPGEWTLAASFDFSPEAAEHSFLLDVTAGAPLAQTVVRPARAGSFDVSLSLSLAELPDQPIDLFLYNERAAFGGHVSLTQVTLTRRPPPAGAAPP